MKRAGGLRGTAEQPCEDQALWRADGVSDAVEKAADVMSAEKIDITSVLA